MFCLTNVIEDIICDFKKKQYENSNILSRKFVTKKNVEILVDVSKNIDVCEISISIPDDITKETLSLLPRWRGMEERISNRSDVKAVKQYLSFRKSVEYELKIFSIVIQDMIDNIESIEESDVVTKIKDILMKWNTFFQFDRNYVLSDNVQQGLYGELILLNTMIEIKGEEAIKYWAGWNSETHDFYCGQDAIEVKSSSAKGPDKVNISNEYQLDDSGIFGNLYLYYIKMKKSETEGERLPDIIDGISEKLSQNYKLSFNDKLLNIGYICQMPELYTLHFKIREENCYIVQDGFPRITTKTISKGIGSVDYVISLDACNSFQISIESFYEGVDL